MKKLILILLVLAIGATGVRAAHYISPIGAATWANSGEPAKTGVACASIATANTNAVAGDTVYLRAGTYIVDEFIAPAHSGSSWTSQIIYSAYSDETVIITNQRCQNPNHEANAWTAVGGATVTHSTAQVWDSTYSTKFVATAADQGIKSDNLTMTATDYGYKFSACVFSAATSVNVLVTQGNGTGAALDADIALEANVWNTITQWFPLSTAGTTAYIAFRSPTGAGTGTWYVDHVRLQCYKPVIFLDGKSFVKVNGIDFENCGTGFFIEAGSNSNEISNCIFSNLDPLSQYSLNIIWNDGAAACSYNWIHGCTFRDNGLVTRNGSSNGCSPAGTCLRIGNDNSDDSRYNLIENNLFYHGGHDCLNCTSRYNTIRNNVFHNESWTSNHYSDCVNMPTAGLFGDRNLILEGPITNSGYCLIEGNRLGYAGTPADADGANGIEDETPGNIIRYNYIYGNGMAGFCFKVMGSTDVFPHYNHLYNNTIYHNGGGEDITTDYQGGVFLYDPNGATNEDHITYNVIVNNIIYSNTHSNYNHPNAWDSANIFSGNDTTNNPSFVNTDLSDKFSLILPNLTLQSGSPAINKGRALTTVKSPDAGSGTALYVADAGFFQNGTWAPPGQLNADWIAIKTVGNTVQVSAVDYSTNIITLANTITRSVGDSVWIYKNSSGAIVLRGVAPDIGAYESNGQNYHKWKTILTR